MKGVTVQGLDEALRWADQAPKDLLKASRKAVRAGARESVKRMKPKLPARWRGLLNSVLRKSRNEQLTAAIGLFNNKESGGHQNDPKHPVEDWFKAYWNNYGTLEGRDPNHTFDNPVKSARIITNYDRWRRSKRTAQKQTAQRRRNNKGQPHTNYFERAADTINKDFVAGFEKSLKQQRYKVKR